MAKMKVHELAKQLEKQSKEIISLLQENGVEVKSHMSSLEESNIKLVKEKIGKSESVNEEPKAKKVKEGSKVKEVSKEKVEVKVETKVKAEPKAAEKPLKKVEETEPIVEEAKIKKKIIFVSNPQNSKSPNRGNRNNTNPSKKHVPIRPTMPGSKDFVELVDKNTAEASTKNKEVSRADSATMSQKVEKADEVKNETQQKVDANVTKETSGIRRPTTNVSRTTNNRTNVNRSSSNTGAPRPYNNTNAGATRPYNNTNTGAPRPYNNTNTGAPRPYNNTNTGGARPYNNTNTGGARPYNNTNTGGARPYNNTNTGGARPYNNTNTGGARPYNNTNTGGARPYNNTNTGGARPYNNTNTGGARPYNNNSSGSSEGYRGQDNNRFKKPVSSTDAPKISPELRREEDKRRIAQGKERRNRKEKTYEDKTPLRPGSFIRPERKVEEVKEVIKVIILPEIMTIRELAEKMKMQPSVIVKKLFLENKVVTVNQEITYDEAEEIAIDYDIICEKEVKIDIIAELLKEEEEDEQLMESRPPVVCVMGHVDHGKTSLLDAIKETSVIDKEAGGITQHIGAYTVTSDDKSITFLDTPGHEAFTSMRMRGAKSTDIAVLVVAADDGVMPQTIEAINHAKAAEIEIIVAINKIDKPNANIDRVRQELAEHELISEEWGGTTVFAPVSAKTGEGIPKLLEMILLTAEVLELKADSKRTARGLVIEARLDKGRGAVATLLVQKGTLHVGDFIAVGSCHGKVRAMLDDKHMNIDEAGPSVPVEIIGLNGVPNAGDVFVSPDNDKEAKQFAETYISQGREKMLDETKAKMSLDDLFSQIQDGNIKELKLIVKADVQGSVEALKQSLSKLVNEEVVVKIIHSGVGAINETDVILASASAAIIIGFNVKPDVSAKRTAEHEKIDIRLYTVIYQAIEDIEAAMKGMLDPVFEEKVIGHAEIRQVFKASAIGNIAGSYVLDGLFERSCSVRVTREGKLVFEGKLHSLKRFKDDVKEVKKGFECGLVFEEFDNFKELDLVEAYKMVEVPR